MLSSNSDPDQGLAAGLRCGPGVVLLTDPDTLNHSPRGALSPNSGIVNRIFLMGGPGYLSPSLEGMLDFQPPVSGTISGTVTAAGTGSPLASITVAAWGFDEDSTDYPAYRAHDTTTAADGTYSIGHLESGRYWLTFTDASGAYAAESYPDAPPACASGDLVSVVVAPATSTRLDESLSTSAAAAARRVQRLAGRDRYDTAAAISRSSYRTADTAVLATGEGFADALSAAALAGAYRAPLFLTPTASLVATVTEEMTRLGIKRVFIVGGTSVVSTNVEEELRAAGVAVAGRVSGRDRYETSAEVYRYLRRAADIPTVAPSPFVARGDTFPDALSVAPIAYREVRPVLLVRPADAPDAITQLFASYGIRGANVVGGTSAVATTVIGELEAANGTPALDVERIQGADRYATAAAVAQHWRRPYSYIAVASGTNFPDAIVGGVLAGARRGAVLLTPPSALASASAEQLRANAASLSQVRILGGGAALSPAVETAVRNAVGGS